MTERTVDEVYAANAAVRQKLSDIVSSLDDEKLNRIPDGEKWSVANIIEHLTLVEGGSMRICAKLLSKAQKEETMGDGKIRITNDFIEKGREIARIKVEAPDFVQPTNGHTVAQSFTAFSENIERLNDLKPLFEAYDSNDHKFPHPFFGGLSAGEWLTLIGAHEARHVKQIRAMLAKL